MALELTEQQRAIKGAHDRGDSFVVSALAGTGKTSTLAAIAGDGGLYVAFNREIVRDAQSAFRPGVTCSTAHSLAFRAVGHQYQAALNSGARTGWQLARTLGIRGWAHSSHERKISGPRIAVLARRAVDRWAKTTDLNVTGRNVADVDGIPPEAMADLRERVVVEARKLLSRALSPGQTSIRFSHDWYLKLYATTHDGLPPQLGARTVYLDECQDADPVIRHLFEWQRCQRIAVGDPNQAIYGWRGATDAISAFVAAGAPCHPLTKSWRFGPAIAELANRWLDTLGGALRLEGDERIDSAIGPIDEARRYAVLCRTNAGCIANVIEAQARGLSTALVGGGAETQALVKGLLSLRDRGSTEHPELIGFDTWDDLVTYATSDDCDSPNLRTIAKLAQHYDLGELLRAVCACEPEGKAHVVVSTAHRAKGRQWPQVRVADDWVCDDSMDDEARRLAYVAVTRARVRLSPGALAFPP